MTYAQGLKFGSSLCFTRSLDRDALHTLKSVGIDAVELSFNFDTYMNKLDFARNWEKYADIAAEEGIELWSIHLPFSRSLDISSTKDEFRAIALYTNRTLIEAAGKAGIKVAVLHPSSEPITDEDRPERLRRSREAIIELREACDRAGMKLAVENLPRTCMCNRSAEMIELFRDTGAGIVFDTNHSLIEENVAFLSALVDSEIPIYSLHISDYDFVDERHRLPGDGLNNWTGILAQLERAGYSGPLMYEVPRQPKERDVIAPEELGANMRALAAGEIK
ncbi:MAG: sugar phosphate isomerase/epimerase [Clostridia bacterium]|nr:sugar phosphate isomerase/epimerase [Clostridia bacterium]